VLFFLTSRASILFLKALRRKLSSTYFRKIGAGLIDEQRNFPAGKYSCFLKENASDSLF